MSALCTSVCNHFCLYCILWLTNLNERKCIYFYVLCILLDSCSIRSVCLPLYKMALLLLLALLTVCAATPRGKKDLH